ncbi:uncharacterized protein LOC132270413 [Cornus florida]|uniref:uncharacterized protein LOC132270413 n=1 Tax=Cornus florida TaxID=4283 RepID=UPI0028996049|nr:uncharacterized protein LOC132270413 [Cornus florida]
MANQPHDWPNCYQPAANQPPVFNQVPPILNQPPQVMLDRRQLADLLTEEYGLELRGAGRPIYRTPYPEVVDQVEFPRGYKVPDFVTFSEEGNQSTVEHIGRFTVQCGEASVSPWLKLRLFPNSLTGAVFSWYIRLPLNSVFNWPQMEELFHNQFYRTETEPTLADLSRLSQLPSESVETFIARFRRARLRCRVPLPEREYIRLALNGLDFELRKRFEGVPFRDMYDLAEKATRYELVLKEEKERKNSSKGTYYRDPNYEVYSTDVVEEEDFEANLAEVILKKPYVCDALTKPNVSTSGTQPSTSSARKGTADIGKVYTFDLAKTEQFFDHLLADKQIVLPKGHNIPSTNDLKGREFCKFHNSWNHTTNNCYVFRNVLQKSIDEGVLKFPEKKPDVMGVDGDPFPNIVSTNVISLATEKAADNGRQERLPKVLGSSSGSNDEQKVKDLEIQLREAQITLINHGCCLNCKGRRNDSDNRGYFQSTRKRSVHERLGHQPRQNHKEINRSIFRENGPRAVRIIRSSVADRVLPEQHFYPSFKRKPTIQSEIWVQKGEESSRVRTVRPPLVDHGRWTRVSHPKFPKQPPTHTQKRRMQRKNAELKRKEDKIDHDQLERKNEPVVAEDMEVATSFEKKACFYEGKDDQPDQDPKHAAKYRIRFGSLPDEVNCNMVFVLPSVFEARTESTMNRDVESAKQEEKAESSEIKNDSTSSSAGIGLISRDQPSKADKIIFEKPPLSMTQQLRPLYVKVWVEGQPINRVLVDNGSVVNVIPATTLKKLGKTMDDVVPTDVGISGFNGGSSNTKGILPLEITIGGKTSFTAFFIIDSTAAYNLLLGRDWIHPNMMGRPAVATMKKNLINADIKELLSEAARPKIDIFRSTIKDIEDVTDGSQNQ